MKMKYFAILLTLLLVACNDPVEKKSSGRIKAVSTITIINDMVKFIGGDKVEAVSICAIGRDPHTYVPKPSDPREIATSDIVFINRLGLEHWIEQMIVNAGGERPVITVSKGIEPLYDDAGYGDPDPHAWFDLNRVKTYARNITNGLISVDPVNKSYYEENLKKYIAEINHVDSESKELIAKIDTGSRVLITSHDAFRYFGKAYGMEVYALQGISTEAKPRTEDIKKIIDLIKERNIKAVFIETTVNPALIKQITQETGAVIGGTLYSDSIGEPGSEGDTFLKAFQTNVNTITESLKYNN